MKRQLIAIYGPAGSGKTLVADSLMKARLLSQLFPVLPKARRGVANVIHIPDASHSSLSSIKRYRCCAIWDVVIVSSNTPGLLEAGGLVPTQVIHCEMGGAQ